MLGTGFTQLQQCRILLQWLGTFQGLSNYELLNLDKIPKYDESAIIEALQDGVHLVEALALMEPQIFDAKLLSRDEEDAYQAYRNYQLALRGLATCYEKLHGAH